MDEHRRTNEFHLSLPPRPGKCELCNETLTLPREPLSEGTAGNSAKDDSFYNILPYDRLCSTWLTPQAEKYQIPLSLLRQCTQPCRLSRTSRKSHFVAKIWDGRLRAQISFLWPAMFSVLLPSVGNQKHSHSAIIGIDNVSYCHNAILSGPLHIYIQPRAQSVRKHAGNPGCRFDLLAARGVVKLDFLISRQWESNCPNCFCWLRCFVGSISLQHSAISRNWGQTLSLCWWTTWVVFWFSRVMLQNDPLVFFVCVCGFFFCDDWSRTVLNGESAQFRPLLTAFNKTVRNKSIKGHVGRGHTRAKKAS